MGRHSRSREEQQEDAAFEPVTKADAKAAKVAARRAGAIRRGAVRQGDLRKGRDSGQ